MRLSLTVNGDPREVDGVWEGESLLSALREHLELPQHRCDLGTARLEVRIQEELRDPGFGVVPDVLANLTGGARERPAARSQRLGRKAERATAHDRKPRRVTAGSARVRLMLCRGRKWVER